LIVSNATVPSFNAQRGETGSVAIDPSNPAYIYGPRGPFASNGAFWPALFRRTLDGGATWDVLEVPGENPTLRPKFMLDPNDPNTMLHAGCSLQRSTNIRTPLAGGGPSWTKILAPGNVCGGVPEFGAIAVAQGDSNAIWAAYRSGDVLKTVNGTAATPAWTQVDTAPPGLPRREPTRIVIDPRDHDVVYISYPESTDNLWKTTDGGLSWTGASGSGSTALPNVAVRSLAIHPRISSWLYAGTDAGVFRSTDGGATWSTQGPDVVPIADLFWLGTDLVAATDGRSMFVAPTTALAMSLDDPKPSQSLAPTIVVRGWGFDQAAASGTGVDAIHVYGFPNPGSGAPPVFLGSATFVDRDDVAAVFGSRYRHSGFELTIGSLTPGPWMIVAYPRSTVSQSFDISRAVTFTVAPAGSRPALAIDAPSGTVGPAFTVRGWALDAGGSASAGVDAVHVYALPASGGAATFLGVAGYGQTRWDVASVYGARFVDSGYALTSSTPLAPGVYTLVVYARSTVSGQWFWQTRAITVRPPGDPLMTIDTPGAGASVGQPFNLAGWAIDRDAVTGPGVDAVHVWAFPADGGAAQFVGAVTTGGVRGDIGAIFGAQFANSGYNVAVSGLAPGHYQIAVYAHSTVTGTFNQARVVTVQVP
jgi:hypothetical protein